MKITFQLCNRNTLRTLCGLSIVLFVTYFTFFDHRLAFNPRITTLELLESSTLELSSRKIAKNFQCFESYSSVSSRITSPRLYKCKVTSTLFNLKLNIYLSYYTSYPFNLRVFALYVDCDTDSAIFDILLEYSLRESAVTFVTVIFSARRVQLSRCRQPRVRFFRPNGLMTNEIII